MKFLTVCLHPTLQRTCVLDDLQEDKVNRVRSSRVDASGKGINVTRVLHQLGESAVYLTQAGGLFRDYFLDLARQEGLRIEWVESHSEIRTCTTLLNRIAHTSTEIVEEAPPVHTSTEIGIRGRYRDLLPQVEMVILSGSKAPGFSPQLFPWMMACAGNLGKTVLLDIRGPDLLACLEQRPDLVKPNRSEFIETFFPGLSQPHEDRITEQMLKIAQLGTQVILTDGKLPVLATLNGKVQAFPVLPMDPVNTIGSGDAFAAGMASAWLQTRNLSLAIEKGICCARQNAMCLRPGVLHDGV